jgi:hypothetical protein
VLPLVAVASRDLLQAWEFMWVLSFAIFISLKWLTWWRARLQVAHPSWRSAAYLFAWPGMDAEAFLDASQHASPPAPFAWLSAFCETGLGAALLWVGARSIPNGQLLLRGWVGMLGLILLLHFGTFQLLSLLWQSVGVDVSAPKVNPALPRVKAVASPVAKKSMELVGKEAYELPANLIKQDMGFREEESAPNFAWTIGIAGLPAAGWEVEEAPDLSIYDWNTGNPCNGMR